MTKRITIPIPVSDCPTRIEVYQNDKLNRNGGVQPGATEASIKLPAPIEECEIRIIPCDMQGKPVGRGYVYEDETVKPEPPTNTAPPVETPQPEGPFSMRKSSVDDVVDLTLDDAIDMPDNDVTRSSEIELNTALSSVEVDEAQQFPE